MLASWAASPARFREDANAEDDLALGGYRDRLVVELAQNAADAGPVLRLRLEGDVLSAANTGVPLTADGVVGLATLRASAKRGGRTVGRFGVGFAAVAAVADEVEVRSTTGSVRFSRAMTAAAVAVLPSLTDELAARGGRVPLLRLPFPADGSPARGFDTEVRVVVREVALPAVAAALAAVDPTLLLVLPGLSQLEVGGRRLVAEAEGADLVIGGVRWRVVRRGGDLDPALLAARPVEERSQTRWSVTCAVPVSPAGDPLPLPAGVDPVLRAPTPTDDPLSLPLVLAASLPLGPDRRRVAPGPLRDAVLGHAADTLAALVEGLADGPARLRLVPGPLGAGEVDTALGSALLQVLRVTPVLAGGRRARDAVVLDGATPALVELLEDLLPGVLPDAWSAARWSQPLRALGVRRIDLAELTEVLAGIRRPAPWWGRLYAALPPDADQLGALPVPLVGGRLAPGPRGLLLADAAVDLAALGLRVVDPAAAHPLLLRLGAVQAEPRALLTDPRVRAAVEQALDEEDPGPLVEAVLGLVGAAGVRPGELPWLAELPLPDTDGGWRPAGELLLPDGPLAAVVDTTAGFGVVAAGTAHDDVLAAVGVLRGFAVVPVEAAQDVDGLDEWLAGLPRGQEPGLVVRDLDLVRDDAWPQALALLEPALTPYALWWLARHPVLDGQCPLDLRLAGSDPLLAGLLDETAHPLAAVLGARTALAQVDPDELLERLADPSREVGRDQLRALYAQLATAEVEPPDRVRAVVDGVVQVLPAEDAVVVDRPDLLARVAPYAVLPVPLPLAADLAEAFDVAMATEVVPAVDPGGRPRRWREVCVVDAPGRAVVHDTLTAPTAGGQHVAVSWLVAGDVDHVVGVEGMARALAWRLGDWGARHTLAARLRGGADPGEADLDRL